MKAHRYCGIWDSDSGVSGDLDLLGCRWVAASEFTVRRTHGFLCEGAA